MNEILNRDLRERIETGTAELENNPADPESQGKTLRALAELQMRKAEGLQFGKLRIYDFKTTMALALVILSLAALFYVVAPHVGGWLHEWRSGPAATQPAGPGGE